MAWYNTEINANPNVIWSRVRYFRNIDGERFNLSLDRKKLTSVISRASELLQNSGFHLSEESGDIAYISYAELGYADYGFITSDNEKLLYMNEPCSLCVTVGGKDMFCIQSLLCGMAVEEAFNSAQEAELLLDGVFDYAYSDNIGYISPEISHTGHGIEMAVALYLPALSGLDIIKKLIKKANLCNIDIYPLTVYENNPGCIYIIHYIPPSFVDLNDAQKKLIDFVNYIISIEKEYAHNVFGDNNAILNKAWRACGIMEYSSSCTEEELYKLLSNIRLCHCLECQSSLPYVISLGSLNRLCAELSNSYLRLISKDECDIQSNYDKERAKSLNYYIKSLKSDKGS